jgi:hypothetical protein
MLKGGRALPGDQVGGRELKLARPQRLNARAEALCAAGPAEASSEDEALGPRANGMRRPSTWQTDGRRQTQITARPSAEKSEQERPSERARPLKRQQQQQCEPVTRSQPAVAHTAAAVAAATAAAAERRHLRGQPPPLTALYGRLQEVYAAATSFSRRRRLAKGLGLDRIILGVSGQAKERAPTTRGHDGRPAS